MNTTLTERNWDVALQVLKPASELKTLPITVLHPFKDHPYKVQDNEEMNALIESVQAQGILSPLIVRPLEGTTDEYEDVSGHRRLRAAVKAGLETVPAFIHALDRDAAAIAVVDSNLHREHILPSEKASGTVKEGCSTRCWSGNWTVSPATATTAPTTSTF